MSAVPACIEEIVNKEGILFEFIIQNLQQQNVELISLVDCLCWPAQIRARRLNLCVP